MKVTLNVENAGEYEGQEVVQIYVSVPEAAGDRPVKELKAFTKTEVLAPGARREVTLFIPEEDLAVFDEPSKAWVIHKGVYKIHAASSSSDIRCVAEFKN